MRSNALHSVASAAALGVLAACHHAPPKTAAPVARARAVAFGGYQFSVGFPTGTWGGRFEVLRDSAIVAPSEGYCRRVDLVASANVADRFRCDGVPGVERLMLFINRLHPAQSFWSAVGRQAYQEPSDQCITSAKTSTGGQVCTRYATRTAYRDVPLTGALRVTSRGNGSR